MDFADKSGKYYEILSPVVEGLGFSIVELNAVNRQDGLHIALVIYSPAGVAVSDCERVHRLAQARMEVAGNIRDVYFEVSSPGLDRPLKTDRDFEKYKGELVEVSLYKAEKGASKYEGALVGKQDGKIIIEDAKGQPIMFEESLVALVKRVIQF